MIRFTIYAAMSSSVSALAAVRNETESVHLARCYWIGTFSSEKIDGRVETNLGNVSHKELLSFPNEHGSVTIIITIIIAVENSPKPPIRRT